MTIEESRIAALEQALCAALSAAEQCGVNAEDLRLVAIGGLSLNASWLWVDEPHVADAETELAKALHTIRAKNR